MPACSASRASGTFHHCDIVGWDTSGRQGANLVVSALTMALARTGHPGEVTHQSDKGSIYTSLDFAFAAGNADMALPTTTAGATTATTWPGRRPIDLLELSS